MPTPPTPRLALRRVLFPTDHGACADRAFAHAAFLAERHGAELRVLHLTPVVGTEPGPPRAYPERPGLRRTDETRQALSVPDEIVREARDADLVVMGTHGRRGVARLAVGSTAEHVMRHADCPVLAVGQHAERAGPEAVGRVLVPVDFSDSSHAALAVADRLAAAYGARVDAVHAAFVPDLPDVYGLGVQFGVSYPEVTRSARESLEGLVRQHVAADRRGEATVRVGPPVPTVLEEADRADVGLLVMPTHGRTGLERLALGSVAEAVLRRAPCAVLALPTFGRVPLPEPAAAPPAEPSPTR
jgi:nucleotide-binding universal stress UspA family protein